MFFTFPDFSVAGLLAADLTGRQWALQCSGQAVIRPWAGPEFIPVWSAYGSEWHSLGLYNNNNNNNNNNNTFV